MQDIAAMSTPINQPQLMAVIGGCSPPKVKNPLKPGTPPRDMTWVYSQGCSFSASVSVIGIELAGARFSRPECAAHEEEALADAQASLQIQPDNAKAAQFGWRLA